MTRHLSPIEAARQRHHLAEVASRTGIWLAATSGTVTARCPMPSHGHPDRTPSLRLYLDDGTWYCFACSNRAGDVVGWVQQTESADWRRAIEILDSGRPLTNAWNGAGRDAFSRHHTVAGYAEQPDLTRTPPEQTRQVLEAAWAHCTSGPLHAHATAYLASRHINLAVLEAHTGHKEAGSTPGYGPTLAQRLLTDDFTTDELVDAGLVHRYSDGRVTDFYRQRALIPIRDDVGRLAGLVGRNTGDPRWPKYKNPPHTALYDKSVNHLYQPLAAPTDPSGRVIVVEGTIDAMAIATAAVRAGQADRLCPVTQSGLRLSARQMDKVLELHPGPLVIGLDGDQPGRAAARDEAMAVRARGRAALLLTFPDGDDPASWLGRVGDRGLALLTGDPSRHRSTERAAPSSRRSIGVDSGQAIVFTPRDHAATPVADVYRRGAGRVGTPWLGSSGSRSEEIVGLEAIL